MEDHRIKEFKEAFSLFDKDGDGLLIHRSLIAILIIVFFSKFCLACSIPFFVRIFLIDRSCNITL